MMREIALKVEQGIRIKESEALWLYQHAELAALGRLANRVNLRKNGKAVFYNINRHINPTNICSLSCKFCAYSKKIGEEGGYAYEIDEMITKAGEAVAQGATELHMVGGLHPRWGFQRYVDMIAAMHNAYPDVHLKAFTAVELDWMARKARKTISEVMTELRNAGLGSFPGGGAEIFHPEVRDQICDTKVSGDQWIDMHRTAHKLGIHSNCTMLYGHIENYEHRVDHMRRLRDLQDETRGFNVFIPLAFQPFQNEMGVNRYTFGSDDLRTIAVARIYLDNFKHIKSYWVMLGQDIAQLGLQFGANDLDGTVLEEKISRAAGGRAGMIMTRSNLENLIRRSGRTPVERTTLYHPVREDDRIHMTPVQDEEISEDIRDMLRALENGETISPSNLWKIAVASPLHAVSAALDSSGKTTKIGQTLTDAVVIKIDAKTSAEKFKQDLRQLVNETKSVLISASEGPSALVLDASGINTAIDLESFVQFAKTDLPHTSVSLRSISSITPSAEAQNQKVSEYMDRLRRAGLDLVEESLTDGDRTNEDKWLVFSCAQAADVAVVPLITLKSLGSSPDWSSWADDVTELRTRMASNDLLFATSLRVSEEGLVMPSEYMKAIALTRLVLPASVQLWTPAYGMTTLSPQRGLGAERHQHPVMKLISTARAFGSGSLGFVPANELSVELILEDIQASGASPRLTCPRQNEKTMAVNHLNKLSKLRHIPHRNA